MKRALLIAVVGLAACGKKDACDRKAIAAGLDERVPRAAMAMALVEGCPALPAGLKSILDEMAVADPTSERLSIMRGLAEDPKLLGSACPGGPQVLVQLAELSEAEGRAAVVDGCKLADGGWATRAELEAADPWRAILATAVHRWMKDAGAPRARDVARKLAF